MSAYLHGTDAIGALAAPARRVAARPQVSRAQVTRPLQSVQVAHPQAHLERSLSHAAASHPSLPHLMAAPPKSVVHQAQQAASEAAAQGAHQAQGALSSAAAHAASAARKLASRRPDLAGKLQTLSQHALQQASIQVHSHVVGAPMMVQIDPAQLKAGVAAFLEFARETDAIAQAGDLANQIMTVGASLQSGTDLYNQAQSLLNRCSDVINNYDPNAGDPSVVGTVAGIQTDERAWEGQVSAGVPSADAGAGGAGGGDFGGGGDSGGDTGGDSNPPDPNNPGYLMDGSPDPAYGGDAGGDGSAPAPPAPSLEPRMLKVRDLHKSPATATEAKVPEKKPAWQQIKEGWGWGVGLLGVVGVFAAVKHFGK